MPETTSQSLADLSALVVTIREGRNRQVRNMCEAIGHPVDHLKRVAIGPIRDSKLKPGAWRDLTDEEVRRLRYASTLTHHKEHKGHKDRTSRS